MEILETLSKLLRVVRTPRRIPYYAQRSIYGFKGHIIYWPEPGRTGMDKTFFFKPRGNQVLILNRVSCVSPGTERAIFNALPNTQAGYPYNPGYSAAGQVLLTGPLARNLKPGDRVVSRSPHGTLYLAPENEVFLIPEQVSDEAASFFLLGVIALQGVRKAQIVPGEMVVVLGQGLIGQLAAQLAVSQGAYPVVGVAKSVIRRETSRLSGVHRFISLTEVPDALAGLEADVVIETSGDAEAVKQAVECVQPGGRVVLLGSPRGRTSGFHFSSLMEKNIKLTGAHISSLPIYDSLAELQSLEGETRAYFSLVSRGKLNVRHLISDIIDPAEAEWFYSRLARNDPRILGALFYWEGMPLDFRIHPMSPLVKLPQIKSYTSGMAQMTSSINPISNRFPIYPTLREADMQMNNKPMKIGLIGCGEIAVRNAAAVHASRLAQVSMTHDIQETLAADLAKKYAATYTTDLDQLLNSEVEAVLISTPHYLHAPLAVQAARQGKHVILEKPIALNVAEANQVIEACRQAQVSLTVMYSERYQPHVQLAKKLINSGAIGKFMGVSVVFQTDKPPSYWSGGRSGRAVSDWRAAPEKSGGGILIFNLVHYLDIIRYLSEAEVTRLSSVYATLDSPVETEDTIALSLEYSSKAIGSILASSCVRGARGLLELRMWGMNGSLVLRNPFLARTPLEFFSLRKIEGYAAGQWHAIGKLPGIDERSLLITRFVQSIRNGQAPDITGQDALAVQSIVEAAYKSGITRDTIELGIADE